MAPDPTWRARAACHGSDPRLWDISGGPAHIAWLTLTYCRRCPVAAECLAELRANPGDSGVPRNGHWRSRAGGPIVTVPPWAQPVRGTIQEYPTTPAHRAHGRRNAGEQNPSSKLSDNQRRELIAEVLTRRRSQKALAAEYGISASSVSGLMKQWRAGRFDGGQVA